MTEMLKRNDPSIAHCSISDGPEYSYARLPTGWMFLVERPIKPCICCKEPTTNDEDHVYVDEDGVVTDEVICDECFVIDAINVIQACRLGL